jgi:imidazole glycerol-phosphate synthase subunit HisH
VIAVVDYGAGNLASVAKAIRHLGRDCRVTAEARDLEHADKVIIPGVGNFAATRPLASGPVADALQSFLTAERPLLGICLGLQWMFEGSEEAPELRGLGAFEGKCARFSDRVKSPHVGWNRIDFEPRSSLLYGLPSRSYVYFTHSYRAPVSEGTVATCTYDAPFAAAVERANLFGVQFHPEKSGDVGLRILENFCVL